MNAFVPSRRTLLRVGATSLAVLGGLPSRADTPSVGEIARLICGSPPGGVLDMFCRRIAQGLQPDYSRSVIVENRTGGSGQIAVSVVKAAAADGMTVLVTPMPQMGIFPHSYKRLPYDPIADFAPVGLGATSELAFAVGPSVPANVQTVGDFAAWCKANPAQAHFGSPAAGSTPHFVGAMAARALGVEIMHVPYRGSTPAIMDLIGGQVAAACSPVGEFLQLAQAGRCRIIATTGATRSRFVPHVSTFLEQGLHEIVMNDWLAFFVPAKTPAAQVQKLSASLRTALAQPETIAALSEKGLTAAWSSSADLAARLKVDFDRWGLIVRSFGFTAES